MGMFLLDFEKAFDMVWNDGLLFKLPRADVPFYLIHTIDVYLKNSKYTINIKGSPSTPRDTSTRDPQGSILRSHLFNVYIGDMPIPTDHQIALYTDETLSGNLIINRLHDYSN